MTVPQLGCEAPELIALCQVDDHRVVGWAMIVAGRVVAYVPEHPRIAGRLLLNTYSSLDAADRRLAYAGIRPVRKWSALLGNPADLDRPRRPSSAAPGNPGPPSSALPNAPQPPGTPGDHP